MSRDSRVARTLGRKGVISGYIFYVLARADYHAAASPNAFPNELENITIFLEFWSRHGSIAII